MSQDETEDDAPLGGGLESEINELLGLFDSPAFMRRGQELEYALRRLDERLGRHREDFLDMVRLRLKQWAAVATGPTDYPGLFRAPVAPLYALAGAPEPAWAGRPAPPRRRQSAARDLAASVARFNRRWTDLLAGLRLDALNRQIDHYNRYYVLEKECVLGSARLAARHFVPRPLLTVETLLDRFPTLPEVEPG